MCVTGWFSVGFSFRGGIWWPSHTSLEAGRWAAAAGMTRVRVLQDNLAKSYPCDVW